MSLLLQLTINGLIAGSIYALVASGFSLIYGTNKFMHFAHGVAVVVAGYIMYSIFSSTGVSVYLTFIPTIILTAFFGLLIYLLVYSPLQSRKASNVILLIASIALLLLFQNLIQLIFGAEVKSFDFPTQTLTFLESSITYLQISIISVSILVFFSLFFFMKRTKLGRDMRALSDNRELASVVGIKHKEVAGYSFLLGSALAGIAGILIALEQNLTPTMGTSLIIKGFTGAVIGGITSVPAAVLGSYLLGLAENYGIAFIPSGFKDAIAFTLLFLFLLFKSNGLFGIDRRIK